MEQRNTWGKRLKKIKRSTKLNFFPSLSLTWPNYSTSAAASATLYLWSPTCFQIPELFSTLLFFFFFCLKYFSLFCCLGCSPLGTLLVVGVERGLFFLLFGLVKRIKITPARLSFTTAVKMWFLLSTTRLWVLGKSVCVWRKLDRALTQAKVGMMM